MKRILALFLALTICITSFSIGTHANNQASVNDLSITAVNYIVDKSTGKPILKPTMSITWQKPDISPNGVDESKPSQAHDVSYYNIVMNNITTGRTATRTLWQKDLPIDSKKMMKYDIHKNNTLDTGSIYEISVVPYHNHDNGPNLPPTTAPSDGPSERKLAITDVGVDITTDEDKIILEWDDVLPDKSALSKNYPYITDIEYDITYIVGDYSDSTKDNIMKQKDHITIIANKEGGSNKYKAESVKVGGRSKLRLEITGDVYPGQIYSVMVIPRAVGGAAYDLVQNYNSPFIYTCTTSLNLNVYEEGEYVRLEWKVPNIFKLEGNTSGYVLNGGEIREYVNGQPARTVVTFNQNGALIEYYKLPKPEKEVEYELVLYYTQNAQQLKAVSPKAPFVPEYLRVTPTQPYIPKPISSTIMYDIKTKFNEVMKNNYLLPNDNKPINISSILKEGRTFQITSDNKIQLVLSSFNIKDKTGTTITDENVLYDVYVTKTLGDLSDEVKVMENARLASDNSKIVTDINGKIIGYRLILGEYYDSQKENLQKIIPNELYYIKIVAKKRWGMEEVKSVPAIVTILFDYDGNVYSPPALAKPPLMIKETETTPISLMLQWMEKWSEVYIDGTNTWEPEVWVRDENGTKKMYTQAVDGAMYFPVFQGQDKVDALKAYIGKPNLISRNVDLGKDPKNNDGVNYKFYKIPYNNIKSVLENYSGDTENDKLNAYIYDVYNKDKDGSSPIPWEDIKPTRDSKDNNILNYRATNLLPNTKYLLLVLPYSHSLSGDVLYSHYITSIVGISGTEGQTGIPDPTVPNLYVTGYTDITATLSWKYNKDFVYELRVNTTENVETAKTIDIVLPTDPKDPRYPTNGAYYEQLVQDLFPSTQYYFWIRAKEPIGNKASAWSNSVIVTTRDIEAPLPPEGIGLGSLDSLRLFDYKQNRGQDFLTLEWLLHYDDDPTYYEDKNVKKSFVYIVEISDNPRFIDPIYAEIGDSSDEKIPENIEKLKKNLIKINKLNPNRRYYIRLKTKVIATGKDDNQLITKTSISYSQTIILSTMPTQGEYDGDNTSIVIIPYDYYETIYNANTKELTHRFRYDKSDNNGDFDNYVVEKLISELINKNSYTYTIDVSAYKNEPITKRNVIIPNRLWTAFRDGKIDLYIKADKISITIPSGSLNSYVNAQKEQYSQKPDIKITIEEKPLYMTYQKPSSNLTEVGYAQQLSINVSSNTLNKTVDYSDQPIKLQMQLDNRYQPYNRPVSAYYWDNGEREWQLQKSTYDNYNKEIVFSSNNLGVYAAYIVKETKPSQNSWAEDARNSLFSKQSIINLDTSNFNKAVGKGDYYRLIYGIIAEEQVIDMKKSLLESQLNDLKMSKVILSNNNGQGSISREEAIYTAVKALEKLQGRTFNPSASNINSIKANGASANYLRQLAAAYELGLISSSSDIRPKASLTYGEMYALLNNLLSLR